MTFIHFVTGKSSNNPHLAGGEKHFFHGMVISPLTCRVKFAPPSCGRKTTVSTVVSASNLQLFAHFTRWMYGKWLKIAEKLLKIVENGRKLLLKIVEHCRKLLKIVEHCRKLLKIVEHGRKLLKIAEKNSWNILNESKKSSSLVVFQYLDGCKYWSLQQVQAKSEAATSLPGSPHISPLSPADSWSMLQGGTKWTMEMVPTQCRNLQKSFRVSFEFSPTKVRIVMIPTHFPQFFGRFLKLFFGQRLTRWCPLH